MLNFWANSKAIDRTLPCDGIKLRACNFFNAEHHFSFSFTNMDDSSK